MDQTWEDWLLDLMAHSQVQVFAQGNLGHVSASVQARRNWNSAWEVMGQVMDAQDFPQAMQACMKAAGARVYLHEP